jgi:hypothetical protein
MHINAAIDAAALPVGENPATVVHEAQLAAAKEAAKLLIASGAVGPDDGRVFIVDLHGHGNIDHQPAPGWANDAVSVHVRSEPVDSDPARWAREAYERYQAQHSAAAAQVEG